LKSEARHLPRAVMLGVLSATLASASCWLALGLQDRTQAEGTGGASGTSSTAGAGPEGGACDGVLHFGTPQVYGGQTNPTAITVDPGHVHVFWINYDNCYGDAVMKLSKVDGVLSPSAIPLAMNQRPLVGLVSDGVAVWTAFTATTAQPPDGGSCNFYSAIEQIPVSGATPPPAMFAFDHHGYTSISLVDKTVAYADNVAYGGSIWVGNVTTGQYLNDGGPLQGDAGQVNAIAAEKPSTFYWQARGRIWSAGPESSTPTCIALATGATSMVAESGWLYWTDATDGTVRKVELPPAQPPSCTTQGIVIAQDPASPQGLAVDSTNVYWASNIAGGAVLTVPVTSSGPVTPTSVYVASSTGVPVSVATDGAFVYATIAVDNQVVAVPILCN
jgi:hypothetical protein